MPATAGTMQAYLDRITTDLRQCGGQPCVRGTRIRARDVLDLLAAGLSAVDVLDELPDLEREDMVACLVYAARPPEGPPDAA